MRVELLLFARAAQLAGSRQIVVDVAAPATAAGAWAVACQAHPGLAGLGGVSLAVGDVVVPPDTPLESGDRVAVLLPVSGGSDVAVTASPLDVAAALAGVAGPDAGAVLLFVGTVRAATAGRPTDHLEYDAHAELALVQLRQIAQDAARRWPWARLALHHRVGRLEVGEVSVVVAAAAPHRAAAFAACRYAIERVKAEVAVWKLEVWQDGSRSWHEGDTLVDEPARPDSPGPGIGA